ncbi:MAG TPA: extracellular solute-binding protein, partial [Anaerolineales bacterium]|nr:extracellular solute-binding protein [Anaerolineales bacterium]
MKIKFLGPNDPALDAVQTAIGKLTDVDVELEIIPWAEYRDVLMQSLQAGESPHQGVYVPGHVWIPEFAAGGLIEDLTPLLGSLPEETLIAYDQTDILEVVQDEAKYLGKQYMVPTFTDGHVFFYRSDKITLDDDSDVPTITPKEINNLAEKVDTSDGVFVLALKAHPSEIFFDWL